MVTGKAKMRKCIGCNELKNREELVKITKDFKTGGLFVNPDNFTFGRSVYICKNENCKTNAFKKSRIFKIFKTKPDDLLFTNVKNCT